MDTPIQHIQKNIAPLREKIIEHPLYQHIKSMDDLHVFMRYHIYAVWDFMSLLKALQKGLTCTDVPWFPKGNAQTRFLINEIVVGEESDTDQHGNRKSHFELYLDAMQQAGADTREIEVFLETLQKTGDIQLAFDQARTPEAARSFTQYTLLVAGNKPPHVQAAVFTFGREDLIPGMFYAMVKDMDNQYPEKFSVFRYYLERHIEVDGDHHSHLALEMTENLCHNDADKWAEAEKAVITSLEQRLSLWNGVYAEILAMREAQDGSLETRALTTP